MNKKGHKLSANIVQKYGIYLRPGLYDHINLKPMTRQQALLMEEKLALDLRRQGYAVGLIDFGNFEHHYFLQRMKKLIEIILMILVWLSFILVSLAIWRLVRHLIL